MSILYKYRSFHSKSSSYNCMVFCSVKYGPIIQQYTMFPYIHYYILTSYLYLPHFVFQLTLMTFCNSINPTMQHACFKYICFSFSCIDIDECESGENDCNSNNYCVNQLGGYKCVCNSGYAGNGTNCSKFFTPFILKCIFICMYFKFA